MERLPDSRQVSEHKLFGRINPERITITLDREG